MHCPLATSTTADQPLHRHEVALFFEKIQSDEKKECPLWNGNGLYQITIQNPFGSDDDDDDDDSEDDDDDDDSEKEYEAGYYISHGITYDTLRTVLLKLCNLFYVQFCHVEAAVGVDATQVRPRRFVCAVGISEGPYLALCILMLHFSNLLEKDCDIVIVPIDLSEGKERVQYQLHHVRCNVLFVRGAEHSVASNWDTEQMRVIDIEEFLSAALDLSGDGMTAINFPNLLQVTREIIRKVNDDDTKSSIFEKYKYTSHIVYTSGTTGVPKGCVSSMNALLHYVCAKNEAHEIDRNSTVLLASSVSFDPCLSDIIATFYAEGTLALPQKTYMQANMSGVCSRLGATHILCTPSLWKLMPMHRMDGRVTSILKVVALGGEPIPTRIRKAWARDQITSNDVKLFATYGVTEACVYQTMGEVFQLDEKVSIHGQCVGKPMKRNSFFISSPGSQGKERLPQNSIGEVILSGSQLDSLSCYFEKKELSRKVFVQCNTHVIYCTGDLGYEDDYGRLWIIGRIEGMEGMIKINGVRVELGEIEAAVVSSLAANDPATPDPILDCVASVPRTRISEEEEKKIIAYCILSNICLKEVGLMNKMKESSEANTYFFPNGPLLKLVRARCEKYVRKGCTPSSFVVIPRLPTTSTGKIDRSLLHPLERCISVSNTASASKLSSFGKCGRILEEVVVHHLNLQKCQLDLVTTDVDFSMLGGDSLTSIKITRTLYAMHHGIQESRHIGGVIGTLEGPFAASHLLSSKNLGEYVNFLDCHGICEGHDKQVSVQDIVPTNSAVSNTSISNPSKHNDNLNRDEYLFSALMEAIMLDQTSIALAILREGANSNFGAHSGRLGKVSSRLQRKGEFTSTPMHVACSQGNDKLVKSLIGYGAKCNIPDASATYPIHLACSGRRKSKNYKNDDTNDDDNNEDSKRYRCVVALLNLGKVPITMKDGNKQTILHCAARSGNVGVINFILARFREVKQNESENSKKGMEKALFLNWTDHWFRTAVHWAILNEHSDALCALIVGGCSMTPCLPRQGKNKRTSVLIESPLQMAERLYGKKPNKILVFCRQNSHSQLL